MLELKKGVDILTEIGGIKSIGDANTIFEKFVDNELPCNALQQAVFLLLIRLQKA